MRIQNVFVLACLTVSFYCCAQEKNKPAKKFTDRFNLDSCSFATTGRNQFFILEPGYQLTLEGKEDNKATKLVITVLDETKKIGNVETRIMEEKESVNGNIVEISRNYFAFCQQTNSIFYFGEEVDNYKNGKITDHEGAWLAVGKNKPGLMMAGQPEVGYGYYQEIAPGIAMDRAEIISTGAEMKTEGQSWQNCVTIEETTPLSPKEKEYKIYAAGIGLIRDGNLFLVRSGFVK
jgi:hypothetical protein